MDDGSRKRRGPCRVAFVALACCLVRSHCEVPTHTQTYKGSLVVYFLFLSFSFLPFTHWLISSYSFSYSSFPTLCEIPLCRIPSFLILSSPISSSSTTFLAAPHSTYTHSKQSFTIKARTTTPLRASSTS